MTGSLLARLSAVVSFMHGWLNGKKMRCEDDVGWRHWEQCERDRWGEGEAVEGSDLPLARADRVVAGIVMKPAHD